jgi:hypothetical protein
MKTSKKILVTIAVILLVLWAVTLFVVRKDMSVILASQPSISYMPLAVDKFDGLDLSSNWMINIKQGINYKLEIEVVEQDSLKPKLENIDGTLHLSSTKSMHARITAPSLQVIKAAGDTRIQMKTFWSDSLTVILEDSSTFSASNNDFDYIQFKASGDKR